MKFWAVVPTAGVGQRYSPELPKQFNCINQEFLFMASLRTLLAHPDIAGIVVTTLDIPQTPALAYKRWCDLQTTHSDRLYCTPGGTARVWSVRAGIKALLDQPQWHVEPDDIVLVHDGVRPCLHQDDLAAIIDQLKLSAASHTHNFGVILGKPVSDSLKRVNQQGIIEAGVSRDGLWQAQTPQAFPIAALNKALDECLQASERVPQKTQESNFCLPTDECQLMEQQGFAVSVVQARHPNPKLTYPDDLPLIYSLLQ